MAKSAKKPAKKKTVYQRLVAAHACQRALAWAKAARFKTPLQAWRACPDSSWLRWYILRFCDKEAYMRALDAGGMIPYCDRATFPEYEMRRADAIRVVFPRPPKRCSEKKRRQLYD